MILTKIPQQRLLAYLMIFGLLPLFLTGFWYCAASSDLEELQENLDRFYLITATKHSKQHMNAIVRRNFLQADHFYLDKYVESIHLLEPETDALQTLVEHEPMLPNKEVLKRLEFLTGSQNEITFAEGDVQVFANIQETAESLGRQVEVDISDIHKILSFIEGREIQLFSPGANRPQLLITEFHLQRKASSNSNEIYLLDLKLLKREYL